jgi:uncharacterized protein involved in outer membrane biogenesis
MRPLRWFYVLGIVGILVIVVLGVGSIWLNSFIHSDSFRQEVETKASLAAGTKVEIKQIDFSIWSGVKLGGIATKLDTPQGTVVAQVESVNCSYSIIALLSRKLQLDGVTVVKPQIVLTQEAASTVPTPAPPPVPATGATAKETESGKTAPFQLILNAAKISDGDLTIRDATGASKADLQGVQASANTSGYYEGKDITGKLSIAKVVLPQNLNLTDFSTPFTYRTGAMEATPLEATAFSGHLTGSYKLDPSGPSLLEIDATKLDVAQIGKAANPNSSTALSGSLALQSKWQGAETGKLTGEGDAQITDGKLSGISILRDLATALRVREMSEPVLKSVTVHFQVANGTTHFTNLHLESVVFEMTGSGTINPQGRLEANMVLILHGNAMGMIPGAVTTVFSKLPGGGGSIPFHISGTVASPQADLGPRLFMQAPKVEKSINKVINHLFH